jgi:hypothetical protein
VDGLYIRILATLERDGTDEQQQSIRTVMAEGGDHFSTFEAIREWLNRHQPAEYLRSTALAPPPSTEPTHRTLQTKYLALLQGLFRGYQLGGASGAPDVNSARTAMLGADGIEAAPAGFAALLVELGIQPASVGIDRLHSTRHSAWETTAPVTAASPKSVHLERPALDLALLGALRRTNYASLESAEPPLGSGSALAGNGWRAHAVFDATGRTAVTAARRIRPARPWVARTFCTHYAAGDAAGEFSIAALPDGYAYRLGAASIMTFGVVGRGTIVAAAPAKIALHVRAFAPWILDGLPAMEAMLAGQTRQASVQWSEGDVILSIGDANLARDALSSQGIATGATEALLAAAVRQDRDLELIRLRQLEQRQVHLQSLLRTIGRSFYADYPLWREYRTFVASQMESEPRLHSAAIRNQLIQQCVPHASS